MHSKLRKAANIQTILYLPYLNKQFSCSCEQILNVSVVLNDLSFIRNGWDKLVRHSSLALLSVIDLAQCSTDTNSLTPANRMEVVTSEDCSRYRKICISCGCERSNFS
ncbi:hypothetical protein CDAR_268561 [Caerostris darwini]|uniref:Uncharacterized protein n=1 Tax=Caerostris darwini TaxID=1538125 RepID=A0AAV4X328_9ARAC|nr:hypothetical protein CDAR_268561 [Caerostris darwini]